MIGFKVRDVAVVLLVMLLAILVLSSCSTQEISDTIGSCCGVSPLPIGALGLVLVCKGRKKE